MTDDQPAKQWTCHECGRKSPKTTTPYTLIGSDHGWRVDYETGPDGKRSPRWWCPTCWEAFKKNG